jgi:hypothetical protein
MLAPALDKDPVAAASRPAPFADQADDDHGNAEAADDPETQPAVRIRAAGSFDFGTMPSMARKDRPAAPSSTTPTIKRKFRFRMTSFPLSPIGERNHAEEGAADARSGSIEPPDSRPS